MQEIPSAKVEVAQGEFVVSMQAHGDFMGSDRKLRAKVEEIIDKRGDVTVRVRLTSR